MLGSLKELVSCWVARDVAGDVSLAQLRDSLLAIGFHVAAEEPGQRVKLKRGSMFGGFDYQSEGLEVQVILAANGDGIRLWVGNWGFPPEPLLMKKRFRRLADRLQHDFAQYGAAQQSAEERQAVDTDIRANRQFAKGVAFGAVCGLAGVLVGVAVSISF